MANESLSKLRKLHANAQALWEGKEEELREEERWGQSPSWVRFCVRVHRSFVKSHGPVRAAALAYTTVLALVPLLAIAVSVYASLLKREGEKPIREFIEGLVNYVAPTLDLKTKNDPTTDRASGDDVLNRERVVNEITGFIQRFRSGTLGASGVLALIFVAISLLSTIEATFNDMWGVREGRRWGTRVAAYWTALTLGPLFLVAALGITSAGQIQRTRALIEQVEIIRPAFDLVQAGVVTFLLPYLVLGLTLSLLYLAMPNARVEWRAALVGGFVAALLLQANSKLSVMYLSRVIMYRQIYESLAAIPLFLLGLYIAWVIVLWGGQVAYMFQTRKTYVEEKRAEKVSQQSRELSALRLMTYIGQRFQEGGQPATASGAAADLDIPEKLVDQILVVLVQDKLLLEVSGRSRGYSPARSLENITAQDVLHALRAGHGHEMTLGDDAPSRLIREQFESIQQAEKQMAGAITLQDLVKRVRATSSSG